MVCVAGIPDAGAGEVAEDGGADDAAEVEPVGAGAVVVAVGKVTRSPSLLQPVTARTVSSVRQARFVMAHSYRIRSRHACDRIA